MCALNDDLHTTVQKNKRREKDRTGILVLHRFIWSTFGNIREQKSNDTVLSKVILFLVKF